MEPLLTKGSPLVSRWPWKLKHAGFFFSPFRKRHDHPSSYQKPNRIAEKRSDMAMNGRVVDLHKHANPEPSEMEMLIIQCSRAHVRGDLLALVRRKMPRRTRPGAGGGGGRWMILTAAARRRTG